MSVSNGVSPAEAMLEPFEEVELGGKKRRLTYGFNTFCELQTLTGKNPFEDTSILEPTSPMAIRALVWACLWGETPRPTIEEVGAWLMPSWGNVAGALTRLMVAATPEAKKGSRRRPR